ncbi:MAG: sigma-70 family RNA polymerase sigma factor [Pseudoxanthomonas sp.]|nr:sigma-70 family RNA polymerase sigma factor [Pseudoxanthomonas sp.]
MATETLLRRWQAGESAAREALMARYLPVLRRLAHNRLPARARDLSGTEDLVQVTAIKALGHLDAFQWNGPGALLGYLRTVLMNTLRDELRRSRRLPARVGEEVLAAEVDEHPSPMQGVLSSEALAAYEQALASLKPGERDAVSLRIEFGLDYGEVAALCGLKTANAARMRVSRALVRLAERIDVEAIRP